MKKTIGTVVLLCGVISAWAADTPIGYVKTLSGDGFVTTHGSKQKASLGTAIFMGSVLQTNPKSSMGVTFKDDTVMSFGPDTQITVDEYLYQPEQGKAKLSSKLVKGTLNYISGSIGKLKPDNVAVQTPSGTIATRGTHFVVTVEDVVVSANAGTSP